MRVPPEQSVGTGQSDGAAQRVKLADIGRDQAFGALLYLHMGDL